MPDNLRKEFEELKKLLSEGDNITLPLRVISERLNVLTQRVNENTQLLIKINKERNSVLYMFITLLTIILIKVLIQYFGIER